VGGSGVDGYCMVYCKSLGKTVNYCKNNCPQWCQEAKGQMWQMNALQLSKRDMKAIEKASGGSWKVKAMTSGRNEAGRHSVLEAMIRSHVLACVCVNRLHNGGHDTSVCYGEPIGIPYGGRWCQLSDTPEFRKAYQKAHPGQKPPPFANLCETTKGWVQDSDSGMIITGKGSEEGYKLVDGEWIKDLESPIWSKLKLDPNFSAYHMLTE
jgi:hypothetical protein